MSEMKDVRLLPCPFCGASGEELMLFCDPDECIDNIGASRRVQCAVCHIEAPFYPSKFQALEAWNRRAALEPAPKPAGGEWVLVPREPTEAMMSVIGGTTLQAKIWKAMLSAAPPAPAASPSGRDVEALRRAVWRLSGSGMSFRRFWIAYADKLDTLTKTNVQRGERALTSPEAPQAREVVRSVNAVDNLRRQVEAAHPNHKTMFVYVDDLRAALAKIGGNHG